MSVGMLVQNLLSDIAAIAPLDLAPRSSQPSMAQMVPEAVAGLVGAVSGRFGRLRTMLALGGIALAGGAAGVWFSKLEDATGSMMMIGGTVGLSVLIFGLIGVGLALLWEPMGFTFGITQTLYGLLITLTPAIPELGSLPGLDVINEYFIAGASGSLIDDISFTPEAIGQKQLMVVGSWLAAGVLLFIVGMIVDAARKRAERQAEIEAWGGDDWGLL